VKTKFQIELETKDHYEVWEDADKSPEDYSELELSNYQEQFKNGLHNTLVEYITSKLVEDIEEALMSDSTIMEDFGIDGWEDFEDYGIKLKIKKLNGGDGAHSSQS